MRSLSFQLGPGARLSLLLFVLAFTSPGISVCADSDAEITLEPGTWGGRGVAMRVLDSGAIIEFDCAMGLISSPISVQSNGRFSVPGRYTPDPGGPVRLSDKEPPGRPAVFSGDVSGTELVLYVEILEKGRRIGPFTLSRSLQAEMEKCL